MTDHNYQDDSGNEKQIPAWLDESLRTAQAFARFLSVPTGQPPEAFRRRSDQAAQIAFIIARLRDEKAKSPFVPIALGGILEGLARIAGVSLTPLLVWLGIKDLNAHTPEAARAAVRLTKQLGFSLRETLAHIRLGFADAYGAAPAPLLLARSRGKSASQPPLEACEALLARLETKYEHQMLQQLRQIENIARAEFAE